MESYRTEYDKEMYRRNNPMRENYNAPPWPTPRTQYDIDIQNKFCPSCPQKVVEKYGKDDPSMYRTNFDKEMQKIYMDNINQKSKDYADSFYHAGYYDKSNPSYTKENFQDDGAYEKAFYNAGYYNKNPPVWEKYQRRTGMQKYRENYDRLNQDPDIASSYSYF